MISISIYRRVQYRRTARRQESRWRRQCLSAITKIPVRADVAMTGEITLRGRVLPIGGLKEKLLAANQAGMKTVIVPSQNKADVEEISEEIKKGMEIVYAEGMKEVLKTALEHV